MSSNANALTKEEEVIVKVNPTKKTIEVVIAIHGRDKYDNGFFHKISCASQLLFSW
jgi:hypothetical protein